MRFQQASLSLPGEASSRMSLTSGYLWNHQTTLIIYHSFYVRMVDEKRKEFKTLQRITHFVFLRKTNSCNHCWKELIKKWLHWPHKVIHFPTFKSMQHQNNARWWFVLILIPCFVDKMNTELITYFTGQSVVSFWAFAFFHQQGFAIACVFLRCHVERDIFNAYQTVKDVSVNLLNGKCFFQ